MTLIKLKSGKYRIVQDNFDQTVELVGSDNQVFIEGTLERISESKWYGWKVSTPNEIREYMHSEELRTATKLKAITRYCKTIMGDN